MVLLETIMKTQHLILQMVSHAFKMCYMSTYLSISTKHIFPKLDTTIWYEDSYEETRSDENYGILGRKRPKDNGNGETTETYETEENTESYENKEMTETIGTKEKTEANGTKEKTETNGTEEKRESNENKEKTETNGTKEETETNGSEEKTKDQNEEITEIYGTEEKTENYSEETTEPYETDENTEVVFANFIMMANSRRL